MLEALQHRIEVIVEVGFVKYKDSLRFVSSRTTATLCKTHLVLDTSEVANIAIRQSSSI